ncbi:hypothetical protein A3A93_04350 [Candidatus Roizmanbacteria bacterium RIFCSPLOWO2_01_FULL_38_12]|uniref:Uncharacterized protein n=1 Tax=Candidatus Roizmanbacteria bacterium RIFCSPLOWO2_01_FULL_38_12 TaxID=1802061 RepID=A0A1F7IXD6_9BACT|nr:MAG: hypothetical protein A2861_01145 [Candidatus Roizmanbacteria bacterium RIFCSPHIGHO2_01_FULL_38_15]OGK35471.1 MAG: hypothetical protein A3F59_00855 [Candidatus Roizmanbacteria bacterium RIFCSPHIGHO2_12_FULL_38_13]OGK48004.1 MAG: hypothetical protein A3A93_04350 [Candidatus Roizmanbacteria bacterium RIFCSPLOWO2_01_FULL_38_12]
MQNTISNSLNVILLIVAIGIFFFLGMNRVDQFLKIKAIDDCARTMRFEQTSPTEGIKISIPVQDVYEKCINDKGY